MIRLISGFLFVGFFMFSACNNATNKQEALQQSVTKNTEHSDAVNTKVSKDESANNDSNYFKASGAEPFWGLEINEKLIVFKTPTDSINMPHAEPILAQDSNVKRYNIETESTEMTIQISQTDCVNDMSGKVSSYSVTIDYNKKAEAESQKLKGCGYYVTDYRLQDIWILETLKGKIITKADFKQEFPTIDIKTSENTFSGFAGCNKMNGKLFFEKGLLRFTNIVTTEMLCEPNNKESEFLKALQSSTTYAIENNRLTLSNPSGITIVFKKTD
ncbi:heat shock protein HslJ [Winogradskyella pacifica]|uniref:Heat shock protein HslJ n=1 Tax=Winogradskyella pacifica TaxID=664642 RepID=A0A3D9N7T9_9FLAO|nr:META domain-containing protein [Winogradskyella pacifica]REE27516.1 heat shock protein HslJ [Winogradskyella pacifica]